MPKDSKSDPIGTFIEQMQSELREDRVKGMIPPIEKRKLRTVIKKCKRKKGSSDFLVALETRLNKAGIYTEPPISDSGLRLDDWVRFSTDPFPPESSLFPREHDLQRFVMSCLGSGKFRNLKVCKLGGKSGQEFILEDGNRIDILCQERTKSGKGSLVAIELKRDHERGTIVQMKEYIDQLKRQYPSRRVKGIIISGRKDRAVPRKESGYDIKWFCYRVEFDRLA